MTNRSPGKRRDGTNSVDPRRDPLVHIPASRQTPPGFWCSRETLRKVAPIKIRRSGRLVGVICAVVSAILCKRLAV